MVFVPPYDDPYIIAGQGTAGAEILQQLNSDQKDNLEAIFVAIGGGGLAAGIAAYTKQLLPHVKVFGVEPTGERAACLDFGTALPGNRGFFLEICIRSGIGGSWHGGVWSLGSRYRSEDQVGRNRWLALPWNA